MKIEPVLYETGLSNALWPFVYSLKIQNNFETKLDSESIRAIGQAENSRLNFPTRCFPTRLSCRECRTVLAKSSWRTTSLAKSALISPSDPAISTLTPWNDWNKAAAQCWRSSCAAWAIFQKTEYESVQRKILASRRLLEADPYQNEVSKQWQLMEKSCTTHCQYIQAVHVQTILIYWLAATIISTQFNLVEHESLLRISLRRRLTPEQQYSLWPRIRR